MWREGRQWEEFISILVVTYLCSETRGTKRRHIGEPCFAKSSLTFAAVQYAGGQNQPNSHCLGHTRPNYEKLFTRLSMSLSAAHHAYAAATPGVFSPYLKHTFAAIWFSDFSSHPKRAQRVDDSPPPCGPADVHRDGLCLHIPEQPRFFQPLLRRSHFEDEPAKLHRERDANKKTHQNTASISNTTSSSPSTQIFLGTEGPWDNSPADWYRTRAWEVRSEQHTSLRSTVIHSPHLFISSSLGSSLERKRKWPYNQVRS